MLVLSRLWTSGVNLPSIDVDAARGGLPRRFLEQNIVKELMFCMSAIVGHKTMVNCHTHQRVARFLAKDMRFVVRFVFLYYSYVAKIHFCTEEFNVLDSPKVVV